MRFLLVLGMGIAALLLVACGGRAVEEATPTAVAVAATLPPTPLPPLPTAVRPGTEDDPYLISLVVEDVAASSAAADTLSTQLSAESDLVVSIQLTEDYGESLAALCDGVVVAASLDAFGYLASAADSCGDLLYLADIDGATETQYQLLALDNRIFSIVNFRDRIYCRPQDSVLGGWLVPVLAMRANTVDPFSELGQVVDVPDQDAVFAGILDGSCDVGSTLLGAENALDNPRAVELIEVLPPVPNPALVLSSQVAGEDRAALQDALSSSRNALAEVMGATSLVDGTDSSYDGLRQLLEAAGMDVLALDK